MRSFQRFIFLMLLLTIYMKTYAAAPDMNLLAKLRRLQQDATNDDRFNEIARDPMDNVLFFLSDDSSEKFYTTTTKATTTTTEAPEITSEVSEVNPMDEEYRQMSDLVFRQSRARIALTSGMMNIMRAIVNGIFG